MKIISILCSFIFLYFVSISTAYSGDYYSGYGYIDKYDSGTGLYIKSIKDFKREAKEEKGFLSSISSISSSKNHYTVIDISIYNPETKKIKYVFGDGKVRNIQKILFEDSFDSEKNSITFYGSFAGIVKNNKNISNRKVKNSILFSEYRTVNDVKEIALWRVDKDGNNLKEITNFDAKNTFWHVDVKKSEIRVIKQNKGEISIKNFDWK